MSLSSKQLGDQYPISNPQEPTQPRTGHDSHGFSTVLLVFIPIIVVILTVLLGLVIFLVAVLYMRRRKGIQYVQTDDRRVGDWLPGLLKMVDHWIYQKEMVLLEREEWKG
jgi:hypothetical protein